MGKIRECLHSIAATKRGNTAETIVASPRIFLKGGTCSDETVSQDYTTALETPTGKEQLHACVFLLPYYFIAIF